MIDSNFLNYSCLEPLNVSRETFPELEQFRQTILEKNKVVKVVEEIHTSKSEKLIELCNSGIMMVNKSIFRFPTERYLNVVKRGYKDCKLDISYLLKALNEK